VDRIGSYCLRSVDMRMCIWFSDWDWRDEGSLCRVELERLGVSCLAGGHCTKVVERLMCDGKGFDDDKE
jgi:hypothetical protein